MASSYGTEILLTEYMYHLVFGITADYYHTTGSIEYEPTWHRLSKQHGEYS